MGETLFYGYIIVDNDRRVQTQTLSSNRTNCWSALIRRGARVERDQRKKELQRQGFRAVRVWVSEAFMTKED